MRWLTACLVAAGISVLGLTAQEKLERRPSRPNILFLFADDMRADTATVGQEGTFIEPLIESIESPGAEWRAP